MIKGKCIMRQRVLQADYDLAVTDCLIRVFIYMFTALLVTAATAWAVYAVPSLTTAIFGNEGTAFYVLLGLQLLIVIALSFGVEKLSASVGMFLFYVYSALMGLTLSVIFFVYELGSISVALLITAGTFGVMAIYGYKTRKDLSQFGPLLFMSLIGIIIASLVNIFLGSPLMDYIVCWVSILVFVGLTAYDTYVTKERLREALYNGDPEAVHRISVLGALSLYLDFINLFLKILKLVGKAKSKD